MNQKSRNCQESEWPSQEHSPEQNANNHRKGQRWFIALSLLLIIASGTFRHRDVNDLWGSSAVDEQVLYQLLVWLILGVVAAYCVVQKRANLSLLSSGPLFWFFCYSIFASLSTVYSMSPAYTAFRSYQLLIGLILVVSVKDHLRCLFIFVGLWVAINWFCVLVGFFGLDGGVSWIRGPNDAFISYEGTETEAWRFASAFGHPANISIVTALAVIGLANTITHQDWRWKGTMMAWLAVTNILTVGRVGLASMLIGLVIVIIGRRVFFPLACALFIIGPLVLMSFNVEDKLLGYLARGQSVEELESFSGREGIYDRALGLIEEAPIYGYGYRSGRVQIYNEASNTIHAHNAFLESYVGLGIFGLFLVFATLLSASWRALCLLINRKDGIISRGLGRQYLALLVPIIAFSMSETGLAAELGIPQLCFLAIFVRYEIIWRIFCAHSVHPD